MKTEPQWLAPDPVGVVRAYMATKLTGNKIEIEHYGAVTDSTCLGNLSAKRYRVVPAKKEETHSLAKAQAAYCGGQWVRWSKADDFPWSHIVKAPLGMMMISEESWLIRDDDPRTMCPRQVDAPEALRAYLAGGRVVDPDGEIRSTQSNYKSFTVYPSDIGRPWEILEEPPCPA